MLMAFVKGINTAEKKREEKNSVKSE